MRWRRSLGSLGLLGLLASGCFGSLDRGVFDVGPGDGDAEGTDGEVEADGDDGGWVCDAGPDGCSCRTTPDCAAFEDGDRCNGTLVCEDGVCVVDPATVVVCDPSGDTACRRNLCLPATGGCEVGPVEDGTRCDDGLFCTATDHCAEGSCAGTGSPCADGEVCDEDADACGSGAGCRIGDTDYAAGATNPANTCLACLPARSTTGWSVRPDFSPCASVTVPDRDYDICVGGTCVSPGCGDVSCNPPGPNFRPADTNQRMCFSASAVVSCPGLAGSPECGTVAFCGEDPQYGWDVTNPAAARFTRGEPAPGEPVVTDNVTGLAWQGCVSGLSGGDCTVGALARADLAGSLEFCETLRWGGFEDWRLPDRLELISIVDYGRVDPAIDPAAFPATPSEQLRTLTTAPYSTGDWAVDFELAGVEAVAQRTATPVRCVRGLLPPRVADVRRARTEPVADEPVVADAATGLTWQGCLPGRRGASCETGSATSLAWQEALAYCELLSWAGRDDWYLPNAKELASLLDEYREDPPVDPLLFPGVSGTWIWSSTSRADSPTMVYVLNLGTGMMTGVGKGLGRDFLCVRSDD